MYFGMMVSSEKVFMTPTEKGNGRRDERESVTKIKKRTQQNDRRKKGQANETTKHLNKMGYLRRYKMFSLALNLD